MPSKFRLGLPSLPLKFKSVSALIANKIDKQAGESCIPLRMCPSIRHRKAITRPERGVVSQCLYRSELVMNPVGHLMLGMVH